MWKPAWIPPPHLGELTGDRCVHPLLNYPHTQWLEFSPKSGWVPLVPCPLLKFWDPFRDAFAHIFYQELSNKLPTEKCFDKLADFNSPLHKVKCSATATIRWWGETKFLPDLKTYLQGIYDLWRRQGSASDANTEAAMLSPVTGCQCPEPLHCCLPHPTQRFNPIHPSHL